MKHKPVQEKLLETRVGVQSRISDLGQQQTPSPLSHDVLSLSNADSLHCSSPLFELEKPPTARASIGKLMFTSLCVIATCDVNRHFCGTVCQAACCFGISGSIPTNFMRSCVNFASMVTE
jgi:hypothetical protein